MNAGRETLLFGDTLQKLTEFFAFGVGQCRAKCFLMFAGDAADFSQRFLAFVSEV